MGDGLVKTKPNLFILSGYFDGQFIIPGWVHEAEYPQLF
jgi:hypothetical protein